MKRLFYDVTNRQRLGMKMKSSCDITFAVLAKLATSRAADGDLPVRGVRIGDKIVRALGA
jgi:hypothetical protein